MVKEDNDRRSMHFCAVSVYFALEKYKVFNEINENLWMDSKYLLILNKYLLIVNKYLLMLYHSGGSRNNFFEFEIHQEYVEEYFELKSLRIIYSNASARKILYRTMIPLMVCHPNIRY